MNYSNEAFPTPELPSPPEPLQPEVYSDPGLPGSGLIDQQPTQPETLEELTQQIAQLETKLTQALELLGDIYRYGKLRDFLLTGDFRAADEETTLVMLEIAGHGNHEQMTPEDVLQFPCSAIQLIDQLWLKYSKGRFGFSVQNRIYQELGGTDDITLIDMNLLHRVGDRLGARANNQWIPYNDLDFTLSAPEGCFPAKWWDSPYGAKMIIYFSARLMACGI
ncbi:MAG: GUN4 domain-containing protein [Oscillatoriales cyanobacterium RM2_1_1]|nr:GUN4 domain-containing protein [Oscillatoriales cyanobacterium SM2_3_0]NJO44243.1 GUN4 domain-containing protein [Oscillatoriales cyanobacterium RM2_1_1]